MMAIRGVALLLLAAAVAAKPVSVRYAFSAVAQWVLRESKDVLFQVVTIET